MGAIKDLRDRFIKAEERRAFDAIKTNDLLRELYHELHLIRRVLEYTAQETAETIADDLKPIPPEPDDVWDGIPTLSAEVVPTWVSGSEAAHLLGWRFCSAKRLERAGIKYKQAGKCQNLSVSRLGIESYLKTRRIRKNG